MTLLQKTAADKIHDFSEEDAWRFMNTACGSLLVHLSQMRPARKRTIPRLLERRTSTQASTRLYSCLETACGYLRH